MTESSRSLCVSEHVFRDMDFSVVFNHLYCVAKWAKRFDFILQGQKGLDAATARNKVVESAMSLNCSHVLFMDGDHIFPTEMLDCLWENRDQAMVSGLVCKKGEGYQQVGFQKVGEKYYPVDLPLDGRVYEVSVCAFGCTLINLDLLKKLEKPYFRDTCTPDCNGDLYNWRSDINLCDMFRAKGEKCWIDTRVLVGHHGLEKTIYPQNAAAMNIADKVLKDATRLQANVPGYFHEA